MTWRTQAAAVYRICYLQGWLGLVRSPTMFVAIFLTPLSFLFFLYLVAPHSVLPFGVLGGILFSALFTGNGIMNDAAYLRLERQIQQVFITSPIRPMSWVLGLALGELVFAVPAVAVFLVVLALVVPISAVTILALVGVILLTWLLSTSLGFLLSTFFRQLREIWPFGMVVFTGLSVLPPVFYPMAELPAAFRWAAYIAPSTFASQLAAHAVGLPVPAVPGAPGLGSVDIEVICLAVLTVLFILAAMRLARWREP